MSQAVPHRRREGSTGAVDPRTAARRPFDSLLLDTLWKAVEDFEELQGAQESLRGEADAVAEAEKAACSTYAASVSELCALLLRGSAPPWIVDHLFSDEDEASGEEDNGVSSGGNTAAEEEDVKLQPDDQFSGGGAESPRLTSWVQAVQRVLQSTHLQAPLMTSASHASSIEQLASGIAADVAPLTWLTELLLPLYEQWTQQRLAAAYPYQASAVPLLTEPEAQLGVWAMQRLEAALIAAMMQRAVQDEVASSTLETKEGAAVAGNKSAKNNGNHESGDAASHRGDQDQRTAELIVFFGSLAKAAQSYRVLCGGAATLLTIHVIRVAAAVRELWVACLQERGGGRCPSYAEATQTAEKRRSDAATHAEGEEPQSKKRRIDVLAEDVRHRIPSLRAAIAAASVSCADGLWHSWYILYGYYGVNLYTDEVVASAAEQEEALQMKMSHMSEKQRDHWRRQRLAAEVQQHQLTESHWLACISILVAVEASLDDGSDTADDQGDGAGAASAQECYQSLLTEAYHILFETLRQSLQNYAQALLAKRGGFQGSVQATIDTQTQLMNVTGLQKRLWKCLGTGGGTAPRGPHQVLEAVDAASRHSGRLLWHFAPSFLRCQPPDEALWFNAAGREYNSSSAAAESMMEGSTAVLDVAVTVRERYRSTMHQYGEWLAAEHGRLCCCMEELLIWQRESSRTAPLKDMTAALRRCLVLPRGESTSPSLQLCRYLYEHFYRCYDMGCFVVLRPERQRHLTQALRELHQLVTGDETAAIAQIIAADEQACMLLIHSVFVLMERRGRIAAEDESALVDVAMPLLVSISAADSHGSGDAVTVAIGTRSLCWTDATVARDLLVFVVAGLTTLPWGLEELYVALERYRRLMRHYAWRDGGSSGETSSTLHELTSWLVGPPDRGGTWGNAVLPFAAAPHLAGSLPRQSDVDAANRVQQVYDDVNDLVQHHNPVVQQLQIGGAALQETTVEAAFLHATSAPVPVTCGLLFVVAAYRSCSIALYRLRGTLHEQVCIAADEGGVDAYGRTAAFCTSDDIAVFRRVVQAVHRLVFSSTCQPLGLLRLWIGYLVHLFLSVVPRSSVDDGGLQLMETSWQQRHHVRDIFGHRVYRSGWRAIQHDGEPSATTMLREALGECLAELMLSPYMNPSSAIDDDTEGAGSDGDDEAARHSCTAAILKRVLPHAVLETLCLFLQISTSPVQHRTPLSSGDLPSYGDGSPAGTPSNAGRNGRRITDSFLRLEGTIAFLRRLELLIAPGSLTDERLIILLKCLYDAADSAATGDSAEEE